MAGDTQITLIGNLTGDPELRFTPSGAAVANFTVASTPRTFDRQNNEWRDGDTMFLNCAIWRQAAENVAETLAKGMRVIVQGRLRSRSYDDRAKVASQVTAGRFQGGLGDPHPVIGGPAHRRIEGQAHHRRTGAEQFTHRHRQRL